MYVICFIYLNINLYYIIFYSFPYYITEYFQRLCLITYLRKNTVNCMRTVISLLDYKPNVSYNYMQVAYM